MDTSYKFSYPCKTISNFYDNFYECHIYDEIKAITYRQKELNESNRDIYDYFQIFQIIYSLPIDSSWEMYKIKYRMIIEHDASNEYDEAVFKIVSNFYDGVFEFARMKKGNLKEAFLVYLFIQNRLSVLTGYSVLVPANLKQECDAILDLKAGKYFLKGWFYMIYEPRKMDLRDKIIEKYKEDKVHLLSNTVEEVYLFGSVFKNDYHELSDIDIVIKYKNKITLEEIIKTKQLYSEYNKLNFDRKTDIQDFNDYIQNHDIKDSIRLI